MSDINIGAISEALNNKVDLPTPIVPQDAVDYVIAMQSPTADNNYTWYRKYKSGWVEQGGQLNTLSTTAQTITLPIVMADTSYYANANYAGTTSTTSPYSIWVDGVTATTIRVRGTNSSAVNACKWQVCGMKANQ